MIKRLYFNILQPFLYLGAERKKEKFPDL